MFQLKILQNNNNNCELGREFYLSLFTDLVVSILIIWIKLDDYEFSAQNMREESG